MMRRMKWLTSIRGRFLVLSALTVGLSLALTAVLLVSLFSNNIRKRIDFELTNQINTLAGALAFDNTGKLMRPSGPLDHASTSPMAASTGRSSMMSRNRPCDPYRSLIRCSRCRRYAYRRTIHHYMLAGPEERTLIVLERLVRVNAPGGPRPIRIAVAINSRALEEARDGFVRDIAPALATLGLILVGASIAQLAFGLKPLSSLSDGIDRIRERRDSRLNRRLPVEIPDDGQGNEPASRYARRHDRKGPPPGCRSRAWPANAVDRSLQRCPDIARCAAKRPWPTS